MKKVLFLVNHDVVIYNFRKELVERLLQEQYEVVISSPYGERIELLKKMGCRYVPVEFERHGKNPLKELTLYRYYCRLLREERPDIVLSYTIKPNLYGSLAARKYKVPCLVNITGLGTAVEHKGILSKGIICLYKFAFRSVQTIFVQNTENMQFFIDHHIAENRLELIPGSGVNLNQFYVLEYPGDDKIEFAFISRIMKEKGIDQFLEMAEVIKLKYPNTYFHVCGFCEEEYEKILKDCEQKGIITYHGMVMDVREVLKDIHCVVHPSYYPEGISNVLLEGAATGRVIITTDRSGCHEVVDDGITGYICKAKDSNDLIRQVEKFLTMSAVEKKNMGLAGRKKVEKEFDRNIVVNSYIKYVRQSVVR